MLIPISVSFQELSVALIITSYYLVSTSFEQQAFIPWKFEVLASDIRWPANVAPYSATMVANKSRFKRLSLRLLGLLETQSLLE